jgi:hypothetical protein
MVAPRRDAACQRRSPVASGRSTPPPPPLKIYGDNLADKIISHVAYTQYYSTWGEHSRLG